MGDHREPEGGDPACWLDRVRPECGCFVDDEAAHRCRADDATSDGGEGEHR